jgi:hypothetical protein
VVRRVVPVAGKVMLVWTAMNVPLWVLWYAIIVPRGDWIGAGHVPVPAYVWLTSVVPLGLCSVCGVLTALAALSVRAWRTVLSGVLAFVIAGVMALFTVFAIGMLHIG